MVKRWIQRLLASEKKPSRCAGCGTCCDLFGGHLQASPADLRRWQEHGREDLLSRVNRLGWIWVEPQTKKLEDRCPFLERTGPDAARCTIHEIKPDICRAYPTLAHSRRCIRGVFLQLPICAAEAFHYLASLSAQVPASAIELACMS